MSNKHAHHQQATPSANGTAPHAADTLPPAPPAAPPPAAEPPREKIVETRKLSGPMVKLLGQYIADMNGADERLKAATEANETANRVAQAYLNYCGEELGIELSDGWRFDQPTFSFIKTSSGGDNVGPNSHNS